VPDNLYSNINGAIVHAKDAVISSKDNTVRGLFGLFETILVHRGQIILAVQHWSRLLSGLKELGFVLPGYFQEAYLQEEAMKLLTVCPQQDWYRLRVQVFAQDGSGEYLPGFLMECFEVDPALPFFNAAGLSAGILQGYHKSVNALSKLKRSHNDYARPALVAQRQHQWDEVLLLNEYGRVAETAIANIFYVQRGAIYTPPLSEGCLDGIMRQWWLNRLQAAHITVTERPLEVTELLQADELFVTNSIRPLRWIGRIGDKRYENTYSRRISLLGMDLYK